MELEINVEDLLNKRRVESDRIEFKEGWNPDEIYHSICAFANDFDNIGGGYILIGVEEKNGIEVRPVKGIGEWQIDQIQKEISSVYANLEQEHELINMTSYAPLDTRPNFDATENDISVALLTDHLNATKSKLARQVTERGVMAVLNDMQLLVGPPEQQYSSRYYRNKRLGEFLKELDLSEGKSTGIPTIQEELRKNGSPKAKFYTDDGRRAVTVEIPIHPDFLNNEPQNSVKEQIIKLIKENNHISRKEMAEELNCSMSTIRRALASLKTEDRLVYEGSSKKGRWLIR